MSFIQNGEKFYLLSGKPKTIKVKLNQDKKVAFFLPEVDLRG